MPKLAVQDRAGPGEAPRQGRRQHAQQHRLGAARLAVRRGRAKPQRASTRSRGVPAHDRGCSPQGKIDAAWLPEPFGTEAQQKYGAVQLADFDQGSLQNFPIGTLVGTSALGADAPEHGRRVPARLQRGPAGRGHQPRRGGGGAMDKAPTPAFAAAPLAATMTLDTYPLTWTSRPCSGSPTRCSSSA